MSEFLAMDGYGAYVWSSYGITVIVLVAILAVSLRTLRRRERMLQALQFDRPARRQGPRRDDAASGAPALQQAQDQTGDEDR